MTARTLSAQYIQTPTVSLECIRSLIVTESNQTIQCDGAHKTAKARRAHPGNTRKVTQQARSGVFLAVVGGTSQGDSPTSPYPMSSATSKYMATTQCYIPIGGGTRASYMLGRPGYCHGPDVIGPEIDCCTDNVVAIL